MDGSSNMDNSIRYRIVLGISITTLNKLAKFVRDDSTMSKHPISQN
jgi:hypothetical protein